MNVLRPIEAMRNGRADLAADWCPDEDTRYSAIARRNVLAGLWAGSVMGLNGAELTAYVFAVHACDHQVAGDDDIAAKLEGDLRQAGLHDHADQVRPRLRLFHREALRQTLATD